MYCTTAFAVYSSCHRLLRFSNCCFFYVTLHYLMFHVEQRGENSSKCRCCNIYSWLTRHFMFKVYFPTQKNEVLQYIIAWFMRMIWMIALNNSIIFCITFRKLEMKSLWCTDLYRLYHLILLIPSLSHVCITFYF